MRPVRAYCDGGLIRSNPSPVGGAWAFRLVNCFDLPVLQKSGLIILDGSDRANQETIPGKGLSNNQVEYIAMVQALDALPDGWSGEVCTDSLITIRALFQRDDWPAFVAPLWGQRAQDAKRRLGHIVPVHMGGHPTKIEVRNGVTRKGYPCSTHQVWCDYECTRIMDAYQHVRRSGGRRWTSTATESASTRKAPQKPAQSDYGASGRNDGRAY